MDYIAQIVLFEGSRLSDWQLLFEDRCVNFVATLFFYRCIYLWCLVVTTKRKITYVYSRGDECTSK